ncbi:MULTISPECIES: ABC transporter permease [unclassified Micromonospora]|uniref:ABC transporter permease n=1 Tax=unclassified Micromonospora TaxID=2617518 RepID=UPI001034994D|nr:MULTISPECIES: ABC transporter permease [unclassified Micromonospora]QKW13922.1 ABC transporter permease [Verrucosispora sp. NA02020]TBL36415.1 ABC transporter permease [Verrucosispora sp. SN26_14.1]
MSATPLARTTPPAAAVRTALGRFLPVVLTAVVILGSWQLVVTVFDVPSFIVPAPVEISSAFRSEFGTIMSASVVTVRAVLLGLFLGAVAGVTVSLALSRFPGVSGPVLTAAVIINCAPIVALAPIFNNWFGVTNPMSKAGVAAVMVFFPVLVNTTRGLLQVSPLHLEIMQSLAAQPRQVALMLRLPNALPYLFNALKLGSTLAVIGVIVTEYFGGPSNALGVYIAYQAALPRFEYAWAGIAVASALGLLLFGATSLLERLLMPWHESLHDSDS